MESKRGRMERNRERERVICFIEEEYWVKGICGFVCFRV